MSARGKHFYAGGENCANAVPIATDPLDRLSHLDHDTVLLMILNPNIKQRFSIFQLKGCSFGASANEYAYSIAA
jgi:hypothetical protein